MLKTLKADDTDRCVLSPGTDVFLSVLSSLKPPRVFSGNYAHFCISCLCLVSISRHRLICEYFCAANNLISYSKVHSFLSRISKNVHFELCVSHSLQPSQSRQTPSSPGNSFSPSSLARIGPCRSDSPEPSRHLQGYVPGPT